jgi:hypothetical protein
MKITVLNGEIDSGEKIEYMKYVKEKYPDREIEELIITIYGDEVALETHFKQSPKFVRIRRITGYLVGTLDRFNDAKRAEEHDRVKHDVL